LRRFCIGAEEAGPQARSAQTALGSFGRKRQPTKHRAAHVAKVQIVIDAEVKKRPEGKGWQWSLDPQNIKANFPECDAFIIVLRN
jgi:hypothetical protein